MLGRQGVERSVDTLIEGLETDCINVLAQLTLLLMVTLMYLAEVVCSSMWSLMM